METHEIINALKEKVGKVVKISSHSQSTSLDANTLGVKVPGYSHEFNVTLLNIYGIGASPVYLHYKDENGKEWLCANASNHGMDEDRGICVFESRDWLKSIDEIDIEKWIKSYKPTERKAEIKENIYKNEKDGYCVANRIFNGSLCKYPGSHQCFLFDEPYFIKDVITYFDKIV